MHLMLTLPRDPGPGLCSIRLIRATRPREVKERMAEFDALVRPTVPVVAPPLAALADSERAAAMNRRCLRKTALVALGAGFEAAIRFG